MMALEWRDGCGYANISLSHAVLLYKCCCKPIHPSWSMVLWLQSGIWCFQSCMQLCLPLWVAQFVYSLTCIFSCTILYNVDIQVHLVSEHIWCEAYLVRSLYLKNVLTNQTRTVTQFHFLTWPESSVPEHCKDLLDFRRFVLVITANILC